MKGDVPMKIKLRFVNYDDYSKFVVNETGGRHLVDLSLKKSKSWNSIVDHFEQKWNLVVNLRNRIRVFFTDVDGRQSLDMISSFPTTSVGDTLSLHPSVLAFQQDRLSTAAEPDALIIEMFYCLRSPESCESTASKVVNLNPSKGLSVYRTAKSKRELSAKNKTGASNTSSQFINIAQPVIGNVQNQTQGGYQNGNDLGTAVQFNKDKNKNTKLNGNISGNFYQMNNNQLNNIPNSTISAHCEVQNQKVPMQLYNSEFSQSLWNQMGSESMGGEYKNDPISIHSSQLGEYSSKIGNSQANLFSPIRRFSRGKENGTSYLQNENTLDILNKVACGMIDVNDMDFGSASPSAPSSSTFKDAEHSARLKNSTECYRNVLNPPRDVPNPNTINRTEILTTDRTVHRKQEHLGENRTGNKRINESQKLQTCKKDIIQHKKETKKSERTEVGSEDVPLERTELAVSTAKSTSVTDDINSPLSYNISTFEFPSESLIMFDGGIYESRDLNALQNLSTNDLFPSSKSQSTPLGDENKNNDVISFLPINNDVLNFFSNIGESLGFTDSAFRSMVPQKSENEHEIENENKNKNENDVIPSGNTHQNAALEKAENDDRNTYKEILQITKDKNVRTYEDCSPVQQLDANAIILFSTSSHCEVSPSGYSFSAFPELFLDSPECSVDRRVPLSLFIPKGNNENIPQDKNQNDNFECGKIEKVNASDIPIDIPGNIIPGNIIQTENVLEMKRSHESVYEKVKSEYENVCATENANKNKNKNRNKNENENENGILIDKTRGVQLGDDKEKSEGALSMSNKMISQSDGIVESRSEVPQVQSIVVPNEQKDLGSNSTSNSVDSGTGLRLFGFIERIDEMRKKDETARLSPTPDIRNNDSKCEDRALGDVGSVTGNKEEEKVFLGEEGNMKGISLTANARTCEKGSEDKNDSNSENKNKNENANASSNKITAESEELHKSNENDSANYHNNNNDQDDNGKQWKCSEDRGCTFHTSSLSGLSSSNRGENVPNVIFTTSNTTSASHSNSHSNSNLVSTSTSTSHLKSLAQEPLSVPSSGSKKRKNISDYFVRNCVKKRIDGDKIVTEIITARENGNVDDNIEMVANKVDVDKCGNIVQNINNCEIKQSGVFIDDGNNAKMMNIQCDNQMEIEKNNFRPHDVDKSGHKDVKEKDDETETELECRTDKSSSSSLLTAMKSNTVLGFVDLDSSSDSSSENSSHNNTTLITTKQDVSDVFKMFYTEMNSTTFISSRIKKVRSSRIKKRITPTFLVPLSQKRKYLDFLTFENSFKFSL